jgi:flavin reductase (DIM6/NTAB) family NADH-FMN oxidoreductase RutF
MRPKSVVFRHTLDDAEMAWDGGSLGAERNENEQNGLRNRMSIDQREFRNAMGCFATGVTIVTTLDDDGAPIGITVNSFTSLSLDPPLVLFCLDRNSRSFDSFHANRHFAVNVLHEGQTELSNKFARSDPDKWSGVEFGSWNTGCPILKDCICNLDCDIESIFEGGDHVILVGRVREMRYSQEMGRPLLYYRGHYDAIAP